MTIDRLNNVLKIASNSMENNQVRMRISAENMANAKSPNYVPQSVEFKSALNRKEGVSLLEVKKIHQHHERMEQSHDPSHPSADENGMVTLPTIDPLTSLMDIQECKHAHERALKVYEVATSIRQKQIQMMGNS